MNTERPAFEVELPNGLVCRIYASGKVEGFGEVARVINRIPQLIGDAVLYARLAEKAEREKAIAKVEAELPKPAPAWLPPPWWEPARKMGGSWGPGSERPPIMGDAIRGETRGEVVNEGGNGPRPRIYITYEGRYTACACR